MTDPSRCPSDPTQPCTPDRVCRRCAGPGNLPDIESLIENSSLGTPGAKRLRESVPQSFATEIVKRAQEIQREELEHHTFRPELRSVAHNEALDRLDKLYMDKWDVWVGRVRDGKSTEKGIAIAWGRLNGVLDAKEELAKFFEKRESDDSSAGN
jgi:hypothetical protein